MLGNKYIKTTLSFVLLLMALWVATPKVYIHALLNHDHSAVPQGPGTRVNAPSADDCNFEKYNKPVYFSLFKFICSFIPQRHHEANKISQGQKYLSAISNAISQLRAPPVD
jgi:hypothetical protein